MDRSNAKNISSTFEKYLSLLALSIISKWNTINIIDLSELIKGFSSLKELPDISKWDISKFNDITYIFVECY